MNRRTRKVTIKIAGGIGKLAKPLTAVTFIITLTTDGPTAAAEGVAKDAIFPLDVAGEIACNRAKALADEFHRGNNLRQNRRSQILIEIQNGGDIPSRPWIGEPIKENLDGKR